MKYGLQHARLLYLWDFPGKNTGGGCCFRLHGILTQGSNLCLLHWQMDSLPLSCGFSRLSAFRTLLSPTLSWQLKPDGIALSGSAHRFCWAARYTSEENFLVLKPSIYRRLCSSLQGQLCNLSVFNPAILPLGIHPPELKAPI